MAKLGLFGSLPPLNHVKTPDPVAPLKSLMIRQDCCVTIGFGFKWEGVVGQFHILSGGPLLGGGPRQRGDSVFTNFADSPVEWFQNKPPR